MILDRREAVKRTRPTSREVAAVMFERRRALDAATRSVNNGQDMPVAWRRGWTACVEYLDRPADGSLRVRIRVDGPGLQRPYTRKLRLVRQEALTRGLT